MGKEEFYNNLDELRKNKNNNINSIKKALYATKIMILLKSDFYGNQNRKLYGPDFYDLNEYFMSRI